MIHRALAPAAMVLVAAAALAVAVRYGLWNWGAPGAGLFPALAAILCLLLSIAVFFERDEEHSDPPADKGRLLSYLVVLGGFGAIFEPLGAMISIVVLFVVVLRFIERQSWLLTLTLTFSAAVGTRLLFQDALGVPLPPGPFG